MLGYVIQDLIDLTVDMMKLPCVSQRHSQRC
jgi:hypothetical protein